MAFSAIAAFWRRWLALVWIAGLTLIGMLMWGGVFGLPYVENERWGGLLLTLILATFGIAFAFPLAILLALGRRSDLPAIRALCVGYIELIRGVPLISVLFMASVMFPLFLPAGMTSTSCCARRSRIILFAAAYLAEVVRGGLQAIPKGQYEAADALGLTYWQTTRLIILPQALRMVIPPLVNTFIGFFKDTSLVLIIGLFDLLATVKIVAHRRRRGTASASRPTCSPALIYFVLLLRHVALQPGLERELNRTAAREGSSMSADAGRC